MLESGDFLTADKKPFSGSKKVDTICTFAQFQTNDPLEWSTLYVWRLTFNPFKCGLVIICPSTPLPFFLLLFCAVVLQDTT